LRDGAGVHKTSEFTFEGHFREGQREGEGTIAYATGEHFKGGFKDGQKHGKSVLKTNTQIVECEYEKGIKNGPYEIQSIN
jgi:hypothetical protein